MAKKKKEKEKTLLNKFSRRVYGLLLIAAVIGIAVAWLLSKCHAGSFVCVRFIVTEKAEQIINVQP